MGSIGTASVQSLASHSRRRRPHAGAAALPSPPPPPPAVEPVPGTEAARRAQETTAAATKTRPHVLLDPDLAGRPEAPKMRVPKGMDAAEVADRIVAQLLQGSGPILLCVPGTLGAAYETSMLSAARAFVQAAGGPVSVASIPYPNGVFDVVTRYFGIGTDEQSNVLAQVLKRLKVAAPNRPILLTGESQGAWLIAQTLREDPSLADAVTRVALFAKPGFVQLPAAVGAARDGAAMLAGERGVLEFRHTDDIVPSLFARLRPAVLAGYVEGLRDKLGGGEFGYRPHHYDWHGTEAARWLLFGERPSTDPTHASHDHPPHPDRV